MDTPTPRPAVITQQDLEKPITATTIGERLQYVKEIEASFANANYREPNVLIRALTLFAIATHNVIDRSQPQDLYMRRKLFCAAQFSLQTVEQCISARLQMIQQDINVEDVEKRHKTLHQEKGVHFGNGIANQRYHILCSDYHQIVTAHHTDLSMSNLPLHIIKTLLGEAVTVTLSRGDPFDRPAFDASAALGAADQILWARKTHEFAIGVLIQLAWSVSVTFGNKSLTLLGTELPASSFV